MMTGKRCKTPATRTAAAGDARTQAVRTAAAPVAH